MKPFELIPSADGLTKLLAADVNVSGLHHLVGAQTVQVREGDLSDQLVKRILVLEATSLDVVEVDLAGLAGTPGPRRTRCVIRASSSICTASFLPARIPNCPSSCCEIDSSSSLRHWVTTFRSLLRVACSTVTRPLLPEIPGRSCCNSAICAFTNSSRHKQTWPMVSTACLAHAYPMSCISSSGFFRSLSARCTMSLRRFTVSWTIFCNSSSLRPSRSAICDHGFCQPEQ